MDDIISLVVTEIMEEALRELRRKSADYDQLLKDKAELSKPVMDGLEARLSPEEIAQYEQYFNMNHQAWGIEREHLYLQGFRDCARLMKWLKE